MRELFAGPRGRVAAGLLVAEFVTATQALVIAATMPRIAADLHGVGSYPLAFGAFFIAFVVSLPFAGPWADRYGSRRIFGIALAAIAAGLALAAIAPNMAAFVGARVVEGLAEGLDYAVTFAVIAKTFDDDLRPRMFSLISAMWILPALVGPGLGAYVATAFGWRWSFAGFLPLVALAALLVLPTVDARPSEAAADPFGALRLLFSRATMQARAGLGAALVAFALLHASFVGADAYVALMLTTGRGLSLEAASFCITIAALGWSAAALAQPWLLVRFGSSRIVAAAGLCCGLGAAVMAAVALGAPVLLAYAGWTISGAGIGLAYTTISLDALALAQPGREGAVSSATTLAALLGILAGVMVCGSPVALAGQGAVSLRIALAIAFTLAAVFAALLVPLARRIGPSSTSG